MLEFWLRKLDISTVESVIVNTHHFAQKVETEINKIDTTKKIQIFHEENLLGTAGTLLSIVDPMTDNDILVIHCDNYSDIDLEDFLSSHKSRNKQCLITMAIFETNNVQMSGMVQIDEDNIVWEFIEKPVQSDLTSANGAIYAFDPLAIEEIQQKFPNSEDIAKDVLPHFTGRIQAYKFKGFHMDMGTLENLKTIKDRYHKA